MTLVLESIFQRVLFPVCLYIALYTMKDLGAPYVSIHRGTNGEFVSFENNDLTHHTVSW